MFNFIKKDVSHPRDEEMIEIFDSTGCRLQIQFKEWRKKVVPENIKNNWSNADDLAHWVLGGLRDNISSEVDEASKRLIEIDSNKERAICFRANVLMDLKRYKEMESVILEYLKNNPKTGVVLTNLAKAQSHLEKNQESMSTLEEGLKIDPNQDNGLPWWIMLYKESERKGLDISDDNAYLMGLTEANRRFGGWRVKQYLGSFFANQKQKDVAIDWFEKALQEKNWGPDLLMAITGDLGKNGFIEDSLKIVEPIYKPELSNFFAGTNLLQSYLELRQIDKGQELLNKMFAIRDVGMKQKLLWYQSEFNKIKGEAKVVPEGIVNDGLVFSSIESPLWAIGTGGKKTGFELEKSGKRIAMIQPHLKMGEIKEATVGMEDDTGKLSRAMLLYLFEDIYYGSDAYPVFVLPNGKNGEYALLQGDLSTDWIEKFAKDGNFDGVLTGEFSAKDEITLIYFDTITNKSEIQVINEVNFDHSHKWIPLVEKFFFDSSGIKFDPSFNLTNKGFKKITGEPLKSYLTGLCQRLTIALCGSNKNNIMMHGERNIIRWLFDEANYYTDAMQCQLGMLSAVRQFINYNSPAAKEYKKEINAWLQNCPAKYPQLKGLSKEVLNEFNDWLSC